MSIQQAILSDDGLDKLREVVGNVTKTDLSNRDKDDDLELDSINRITLIAELENVFQLEIPDTELVPEVFTSLGSLSELINKLANG